MLIKNGSIVRIASRAEYESKWHELGYTPVEALKPVKTESDAVQDTEQHEGTDWENMTKNELVIELVKRGIEFNKRQNKAELIQLLEG